MVSLSAAKVSNASFSPSYRPTAVFIGGTGGIGQSILKAFAKATKGNACIVIVGRNRQNAEAILTSLPQTEQSDYSFVECDAFLMKNIVKTCIEIKSKIDTLNFLVVSQGMMTMDPYTPTEEGLDRKLAVNFYGRWKFCDELLPCLEKASAAGQDARFMTIGTVGHGGPIDVDDIGLKKTFTVRKSMLQSPSYNDAMLQEYSRRYPQIAFIHNYPGFVYTPLFNNLNFVLWGIVRVLAFFIATSPEDCGGWLCYALLTPKYANGGHYLNEKGEPLPDSKIFVTDEARSKVVEHYGKATAV